MTEPDQMTAAEYRQSWDPDERTFQAEVVAEAKRLGYLIWHDNDSRRNDAGLPDLIIVGGGVLRLIELKTNQGRLRPDQRDWLDALATVTRFESGIWRPRQWDEILAILAGEVGILVEP